MHIYKDESKEWYSCKRKNRYRTEKDVMIAVKKCKNKYDANYDYYQCPYCTGYHLTKE